MKKKSFATPPVSAENLNPLYSYIYVDPETVRATLDGFLDPNYTIAPEPNRNVFYLRFDNKSVNAMNILLREQFGANLIQGQCHISVFESANFAAPRQRASGWVNSTATTQSHITLKYNSFETRNEETIRIYYDNNWQRVSVDFSERNPNGSYPAETMLRALYSMEVFSSIEISMGNLIDAMHQSHFAALTIQPKAETKLSAKPAIAAPKIEPDLLISCQSLLDAMIKNPQVDPMLFFFSAFPSEKSIDKFIEIFLPILDIEVGKQYIGSLIADKDYKEIREIALNRISELLNSDANQVGPEYTEFVLSTYRRELDALKTITCKFDAKPKPRNL